MKSGYVAGKTKVGNSLTLCGHNRILLIFERNRDIMALQVICKIDLNQMKNVVSIVFTRNCEWTDGRRAFTVITTAHLLSLRILDNSYTHHKVS